MIRRKISLPKYLPLIAFFLAMGHFGYAQKAKKLNVAKPKPSRNVRVKSNNDVKFKNQKKKGAALLLNGSKQIGGRFVYFTDGFGGEIDFGYIFKERFIAEAGAGALLESSSEVDLLRIPIHVGVKYRLFDLSKLLVYSGIALNIHIQTLSNIETSEEISSTALGPSFFGEGVFNVGSTTGIVLRAEQVLLPTQKFQNSDGKDESLQLLNFSVGLRKTF